VLPTGRLELSRDPAILGKVPATDEEKAKARRIAFLASRTNTMLSFPMLFFMAFGFHHQGIVGL